jgi:hypothetical protein
VFFKEQKLKEVMSNEHFGYEVGMLTETYKRLATLRIEDPILANALIESFCIHARILIDFFNGRRGVKAKEVTLETYQPFQSGQVRQALTEKLNTQIAHLTLKRTSVASEKIGPDDRKELFDAIMAELQIFMMHLKKEYRSIVLPGTLLTP